MNYFRSLLRTALACAAAAALAGCGEPVDDSVIDIAFIGAQDAPFETGLRLSPAGQQIRAATAEGLVALNANGEVVPALAERWIVTDDGLSYIFRLRNSEWADGRPITGASVRDALQAAQRNLRGTSLGLDLSAIDETVAMAGRVVEIRLKTPMPDFLHLMAQPELALVPSGASRGTGPMVLNREGDIAVLDVPPPDERDLTTLANLDGSPEQYRQVRVRGLDAPAAMDAFAGGEVDVVLGGTLASLPLADTGPLARGTVRLDAATGLFGLHIRRARGLLAEEPMREALAMAIDRETLLNTFNLDGWGATTRILPTVAPGDPPAGDERWANQSLEQRQDEARRRILTWRAANKRQEGELIMLSVAAAAGPGTDILLQELSADLAVIGVGLERAETAASADLRLVDRVARFAGLRWYLNQFNCALKTGLCSPLADDLVAQALASASPLEQTDLLAEAEAALVDSNAYIPLGAPIRWALVRSDMDGFAENPWALHPLFPFALRPI